MSYVASVTEIQQQYLNKAIGTGQCVAFVEAAAKTPHTAAWKRGRLAKGDTTVPEGTAIATFDPDGTYGNHTDGRSHGAIYVSQIAGEGLLVYDQWSGQPVHQRVIHFRDSTYTGHAVNDGNQFYVVE
jgi:hypothetical protein